MSAVASRCRSGQPVARVAIVGGGPVGLLTALTLARMGVGSTVLEADEDVCDGSRAICISRRSLQILDRLDVAAPFLGKGLAWSQGRSYLGMREVFRLCLPQSPDDRFPPFINLQQHRAEAFLAEACAATGRIDLRRGCRAHQLRIGRHGVELDVRRAGRSLTVAADWVVAADGAHSFVRERGLGLSLEGRSFESRYLIADIELDCDWPTERRVWFDPSSNPGSTVIMHKQPEGVWRIDYQLRPEEEAEAALRDESVCARISSHLHMIGLQSPWRLVWKTIYRAHTLSLADYVHGPIAFAGDAAHLVPIFGVRGLNSGFEDAFNLGWKLALVARGLARPALLATYTEERRGACLENIASATKATWFMSPPTDGYACARDAVLELAVDHPQFRPLIDPRQAAPHRYRSRAIADPDLSLLVGNPLPEARLDDGRSLHELLGDAFTVIRAAAGIPTAARSTMTVSGLEICQLLLPSDDRAAAALQLNADDLILVRPDGYVAASAVAAEAARGWIERALRQLMSVGSEPPDVAA